MKTLLLAGAAFVALTSTAVSAPLDDFRQNGQIGGWADLDFAMQNEVTSATNRLEKKAEAGTAGAAALAMLPEGDNVLSLGVAKHSSGEALAIGYSKNFGTESEYLTKVGMSYNSESDLTIGAGIGIRF